MKTDQTSVEESVLLNTTQEKPIPQKDERQKDQKSEDSDSQKIISPGKTSDNEKPKDHNVTVVEPSTKEHQRL